ncbi:DNA methyltransferase [Helicobacter pylori]|uniref:DNA methyltransferase n=1 Tax=Helicobacter pylori TaxID=210 RepID=UPI003DA9A4E5
MIWQKKKGGSQDSENFAKEHEYILCYQKEKFNIIDTEIDHDIQDFNKTINGKQAKILKLEKWGNHSLRTDRPTLYYAIKDPSGNDFYPIAPNGEEGCWRKKPENLDSEHIFWQENSKGRLIPYEVIYYDEIKNAKKVIKTRTIFTEYGTTTEATKEILTLFNGTKLFDTPKPEALLKRIIEISTQENDLVLDFFAGSGTTCAVAHKLKRKYIGIEMGEHFDSVILPRLKKVIGGFKSGAAKEFNGGGVIKVYALESYEEILRKIKYEDNDKPLSYDEQYSDLVECTNESYTLNLNALEKMGVDIKETLENLWGLKVEFFNEKDEKKALNKTKEFEEEVKKRFINEPNRMKLLIVVDKLLTGFDAPSLAYFCGSDLEKNAQKRRLFYQLVGAFLRMFVELNNLKKPIYSKEEMQKIKQEAEFYRHLQKMIGLNSGDSVDLKSYSEDMRRILDAYIKATDSKTLIKIEDQGLCEVLAQMDINDFNKELSQVFKNESSMAESIANNTRKRIIEKEASDPKYYEKLSSLLNDLINQFREKKLTYLEYLQQIHNLAKQVIHKEDKNYPKKINTNALKTLYDNLDQNEALALEIDACIRDNKKDGWVGHNQKEKNLKIALRKTINDEGLLENTFNLAKHIDEYH